MPSSITPHGLRSRPARRCLPGLIDYRSLRGKRVLEVGSGLGAVSATLARQGAEVTALDLTWTGASSTARRFGLDRTRGAVVQGEAERLPLADESFDFVWSWGVILHAPNPARAIAEMHRVLRPGGEVCVMVYNRHSFYNWLGIVARHGVLRMQLLRHSVQDLWNRVLGRPRRRRLSPRRLFQRRRTSFVHDGGGLRGSGAARIRAENHPDALCSSINAAGDGEDDSR